MPDVTIQGKTDRAQIPSELVPLEVIDLGVYAGIDVSPEPMYGPDELGTAMCAAIEDLSQAVTKSESAPRIFEVLQAWEARLFERNYQFNVSGKSGWGFFGSSAGAQGIANAHDRKRLWSANVYGARKDKIVAAIAREIPTILFSPADPEWGPDQTYSEEAEKYIEVWKQDTDLKKRLEEIISMFYTDGTAILHTYSCMDQQRWGTEQPAEEVAFGDARPTGITPETELAGEAGAQDGMPVEGAQPPGEVMPSVSQQSELPAIAEVTEVGGKLEWKRPLISDHEHDMGWIRRSKEYNANICKEKYPWIEDSIKAGSGLTTGNDQFDRLARMNVRLAVANSSVNGESYVSDCTETFTWFRPSQYRQIADKGLRKIFYQYFPKGLRTTHIGTSLAFARNESMSDHVKVLHARTGSGQNRRAIGTNYLPLQKVLNSNISLVNKYFQACVPRRFFNPTTISADAINGQTNDPGHATPVLVEAPDLLSNQTAIETVPQISTGLMEFVQWLIEGAPEAMDGASPAMFGMQENETFGQTKLNRDMALQIYATPWAEACWGLAGAASQAAQCASANRRSNIRSKIPGAGRLVVELDKMQGKAYGYPKSVDIPESLAEMEQRMSEMMMASPNVPLLAAIVNDPRNLTGFEKIARFAGLTMPGVDNVEKQQGEFEMLMKSGPVQNPMIVKLQQAIQQATESMQQEADPNAIAQGQQAIQQIQQAIATLPPMVSSVPVAQDSSEDHAIHAAITLGFMTSAEGRKLENGDPEPGEDGGPSQQDIFQNLTLHWQGHMEMKQKLQPVPPLPVKLSASVALDKLPPEVQTEALQAAGLDAKVEDFHAQDNLVPHEVSVEKNGVDAQGVPVKTKQSFTGPGKLS